MSLESKSNTKGRIEEIVDAAEDVKAEDTSGSEGEGEDAEDAAPQASSSSTAQASSSKKKGKKKAKAAAKALSSLVKGKDKDKIPQAVVEEVLQRVKQEQGDGAEGADETTVRLALEQMKIMDVLKGKSGIGGKNKKDTGDHKFWATQPVPQIGEELPEEDGFIEPSKPPEEVRQDAYPLPKDFEWCIMDISDAKQLKEVYELLSANYVEDDDASFRFKYSAEFLKWALMPPGYFKEWHVGVRVASNRKLVAFISGVPMNLKVRSNLVLVSEINYLCVHKKLRSKRLAPVLIKEVTRQCHLKGIFQAIYTAGVLLPTPISVCRYHHRPLNVPKLIDVQFTFVPRNMTLARMIRLHKVPSVPLMARKGLREMEDSDIEEVCELYGRYMKRFDMAPVMNKDEVRHHLLSGKGKGEKKAAWAGRREEQVVWTYVVENPETHIITDFFSFYSLPSTIIGNTKHDVLEAAYMFYYATDVGLEEIADRDGRLRKRLQEVVGDALSVAEQAGFDVFNALTLMDNVQFLEDLKFGAGDGLLNFYLYNWRTAPLAGVKSQDGVSAGRGVGVVML